MFDYRDVERRYQEQIKLLMGDAEAEREMLIQQSNKQRHKLEADINKLKDEEIRLKDRLHEAQKAGLLTFTSLAIDITMSST